ncbi:MAG: biopolymer transporter ExbD [Bacteroidales bacterium]|nr:biopolymer transporter ExbD [Bacteroidales bacterium]MCF8326774.1 biopolymer transporter ExbD [Bacteroidales bacterium]
MAIRTRNKRDVSFNFSSMSDLVFLLLIFFVLTSTLIAPNAIKLLLPASDSKTMANPQVVQVYISPDNEYYLDGNDSPVSLDELNLNLSNVLEGHEDASVVVRSDKSVAVQYVVNVIDLVNNINDERGTTHKVILATRPK